MAVGFNSSSSRLMAYTARRPQGGAAPQAAQAYPHLFGPKAAAPTSALGPLEQLRQQLLAIQSQIAVLLASLRPPAPAPTPVPVPAPGGVTAGSLSLEQLRSGHFQGALFGSSTPKSLDSADSLAGKLGRQLDLNHTYYRWEDKVPSAETRADVAAGRVPWISFNATSKSGQTIRWADIASGKHDAHLRQVAQGLKSLGKPVMFTFNHEPENDEERGTPAEYRAAWKRVSDILKAEGATNAVKVYVTMGWKPELSESFYPGDSVDWIAGDPYNWAFSKQHPDAQWRSFEQATSTFYTWAKTKGKPIMIGETGCIEDPGQPGRKAQWLKDMGEALKRMPEIKALCYFNNNHDDGQGANNWHVGTPQALQAFKQVAQDPYFARH